MPEVKLTLACGRYDRTQALIDGRVRAEGVALNFLPLRPGETFWRMLNNGEFDASEMSLSSYTILRSQGDERFVAIPVFPSRVFRHSAVYLRDDSPIRAPAELKGKRIGVADYQMTAAVWVRGFLQHDYGVRPQDVTWVIGRPVRRIAPPEGIRFEQAPAGVSLETLLERGDIDALISVMLPRALGTGVKRLFPDFRQVEAEYYRKTGIFPIMHTLDLGLFRRRQPADARGAGRLPARAGAHAAQDGGRRAFRAERAAGHGSLSARDRRGLKGAKQKPRFLFCALKKAMDGLFQHSDRSTPTPAWRSSRLGDADPLIIHVCLESDVDRLAPQTALLDAGKVYPPVQEGVVVQEGDPGFQFFRHLDPFLFIPGPDRGAQAVFGIVGPADGLVDRFKRDDRDHGPELLAPDDGETLIRAGDDRGQVEVTVAPTVRV